MKVWTFSLNGELQGIFDTEEKAVEARREQLASGLEGGRLAVLSISQWTVRLRAGASTKPDGHSARVQADDNFERAWWGGCPHANWLYERKPMPRIYHQPATAVTGSLEPRGQREGADSGDPQISWTAFDSSKDVKVGVWQAAPGGWPIVNRENTETCYIVSGQATITDDETGEKNEISAGHVVTFPKGWSGRWDVTETIRKVYSIVVPGSPG